MRDGLYKVHFQTPLGWGSGIVYAFEGKLWGGDAGIYYVGTYVRDGNQVTADVKTDRHTQHPAVTSVFGRDQVRINLTGVANGDTVKFNGKAPEAPDLIFSAELTRLSD